MKPEQALIFELSHPGRIAYSLPECDVPEIEIQELIPTSMLRSQEAELPEVYEVDVIRHYTALSRRNFGVDNGFYPLGSCTMKYNPKINEDAARLTGLAAIQSLSAYKHGARGSRAAVHAAGRPSCPYWYG